MGNTVQGSMIERMNRDLESFLGGEGGLYPVSLPISLPTYPVIPTVFLELMLKKEKPSSDSRIFSYPFEEKKKGNVCPRA